MSNSYLSTVFILHVVPPHMIEYTIIVHHGKIMYPTELHTTTEIITICCLVHFFIVVASIDQPDGAAPMAEFANVFDPSGDPQKAMVGMMKVSILLCDDDDDENEANIGLSNKIMLLSIRKI